jgi:hypothetical protein
LISLFTFLISSIDEIIKENLNIKYQINFSQLGGEVINGTSCYFPKEAIAVLTLFIEWNSVELTVFSKAYVNTVYKKIVPYTSKYCLTNITDYDLLDYMDKYYGSNKGKLIDIKNKYDPLNFFNYPQSIPLKK